MFPPLIDMQAVDDELIALGVADPAARSKLILKVKDDNPGLVNKDSIEFRRRLMEAAKVATRADPRPSYSPEHAMWFYSGNDEKGSSLGPNEFQIFARKPNHQRGAIIATVRVHPDMTQREADHVACMMAYAPDLWRSLQRVAPIALNDAGPNESFREAMDGLWQAAGRFPFEWPRPDRDEEDLMKGQTVAATDLLGKGGVA